MEIERGGMDIVDRHGVWDGWRLAIWLYIFVLVACVRAGQALLHQSMLYLAIPFEEISS